MAEISSQGTCHMWLSRKTRVLAKKKQYIYIYACLELKGRDAKPRLQTSVVAKVINSVLVTSSRSSFLPRFRDTAMIGYGMRASGC